MKSTLYPAVRALLTAALLSSTALLASAQTVTPGANSASCQVAPAATGLQYTFTPGSGQTLVGWSTKGDLQITSASTANPVVVQSTGLGRGQIIANYSIGGCNPIPVPYEVNKVFSTTEPIIGPECVLPGVAYTWSIKPIISSATQISAQIGIDKYTWKIDAVSGTPPVLPTDADSYSGDLSAIRIVMPANVGTFTLSVKVGDCNAFGPSILVRPTPPTPVFVAGPSCRPTSDVSPFNITITSLPGVKYTWNVPPTWTINTAGATTGIIATSTTSTINVTPDANGGDITVTASNGGSCAEPTARYTLKRQLSPSAVISGIPTCFTVGTPYTISVAPVANNSKFYWSIPAGYSGNGTPGPAVVETGSSSISIIATTSTTGRLAVSSDQCGDPALVPNATGVVSANLRASGNNGCTYSYTDLGCGAIQLTSSGTGCLPTYNATTNPGVSYTYSSPSNPQVTTRSRTYAPDNGLNNEIVTVTVRNTATCFEATFQLGPINSLPCGRPGGTKTTKEALMVYPNPTSGSLNIDLPLQAGETGKLTLTDATGRQHLVSSTKEARAKMDVSKLPQGVYTLRAELTSGKVLTQKVVVSHDAPASSIR